MSNHIAPMNIEFGENSVAYCSYHPPKNLIIFVHGFNGHAVNTWDNFPQLIQTHSKFKESDVIFYGYDSLKAQANNMKLRLYKLIDMAVTPARMVYGNLRILPNNFTYTKIIIVAHSLGAIVTRLALIHAANKKTPWCQNCRMVLYAPAHFGSRIPDNFRDCFLGFTSLFQSFAVTKYPIIRDLTEGSLILNQLESKTRRLIDSGVGDFVKAKVVVWASDEIVVINDTFCDDEPEEEIVGTTHISVCKPDNANHESIDHLLKVI